MFIDASALVAMMTAERDGPGLMDKVNASIAPPLFSSFVVYEAVLAIARKTAVSAMGEHAVMSVGLLSDVESDVEDFLAAIDAVEMPLSVGLHKLVLDAARRYGRGTGHAARLNFGDCFSYACAKSAGVPLLFVGDDFSQTDIAAA